MGKKCAVITGAASGIGYETTKKFLREGYNVVLCDINEPTLQKKYDELPEDLRVNAITVKADITSENDVANLVETAVAKYGQIDAFYNGAGILGDCYAGMIDADIDDTRRVIEVDLMGAIIVNLLVGRQMVKQGSGVIVNTASIAALQAGSGPIGYSTSKAGVVMLSKCLAMDIAQYGVRVVTIAPGWVVTEMTIDNVNMPGMREVAESMHATKTLMKPADQADAIYLLCQDEARVINGSVVLTDNGFNAFKTGAVNFTTADRD